MTPQWGGHMKSRGNLNTLYLHLQKTYEHWTKQGADLTLEATPLKQHNSLITWPTWGHVTSWEIYNSTLIRPMKLVRYKLMGGGSACKCLSRHWLVFFSFSFLVLFFDGLTIVVEVFFYFCFRWMRPISVSSA